MIDIPIPATATTGTAISFPGGWGTLYMAGTFDSATYTLQFSPDAGATWFTVVDTAGDNIALTAAGYKNFVLAGPGQLRLSRASGTSPSGMIAKIGNGQTSIREY